MKVTINYLDIDKQYETISHYIEDDCTQEEIEVVGPSWLETKFLSKEKYEIKIIINCYPKEK